MKTYQMFQSYWMKTFITIIFVSFSIIYLFLNVNSINGIEQDSTRSDSNLIAHWSFNEGSGSVAYDSSDSEHNGNINGASWTQGVSGTGLNFSDDHVNFGDFDFPSSGTIMLWFNPNINYDGSAPRGKLWYKYDAMDMDFLEDGRMRVFTSPSENFLHSDKRTFQKSHWYHIAFSWGGTGKKLYFDGELENQDPASGTPLSNSQSFFIGASSMNGNPPGEFFQGAIDEVKVFNKALSSNDIISQYNSLDDTESPIFSNDETDVSGTTGDPFLFQITADDNVEIEIVEVIYWFNTEESTKVTMDFNTVYIYQVLLPIDEIITISYYFIAWDTSGNSRKTSIKQTPIYDNDPPEIYDISKGAPKRGFDYQIQVKIVDNVEIVSTDIEYWLSHSDKKIVTFGNLQDLEVTKSVYVNIPNEDGIRLYFNVTALDWNGNSITEGPFFKIEGDAFPDDPAASTDTDGDGFPNEWIQGKSSEDSTTGITHLDAFPDDVSASIDSDNDGFPDNWNIGMGANDSSGDLYLDSFPLNPVASLDSDGDGYPDIWNTGTSNQDSITGIDHLDAFPYDISASIDTDNDGYPDSWNPNRSGNDSTTGITHLDSFPDDISASLDTDLDGYPDKWNDGMVENNSTLNLKLDKFPKNPEEWKDTDNDGIGDNSDILPSLHTNIIVIFICSLVLLVILLIFTALIIIRRIKVIKEIGNEISEISDRIQKMEHAGMSTDKEKKILMKYQNPEKDNDELVKK